MEGKTAREAIFHAVRGSNLPDLIAAVSNYREHLRDEELANNNNLPIEVDEEIKRLLNEEYEGYGGRKVELLLNMAVNQNNHEIVGNNHYLYYIFIIRKQSRFNLFFPDSYPLSEGSFRE